MMFNENYKDVVPCERFLGIETPDPIYGIGEKVNVGSRDWIVESVRWECLHDTKGIHYLTSGRWMYFLTSSRSSVPTEVPEHRITSTSGVWNTIRRFLSVLYNDAHVLAFDRPPK